jgi:creatinine amidohydrolase
MRRALVFLVALLAASAGAETVHLTPTRGETTLAVRPPLATIHTGDRIESLTLGGDLQGASPWPGDVGPIAVAGAEPGDALIVEIERLAFHARVAFSTHPSEQAVPAGPSRGDWLLWRLEPDRGSAELPGEPGARLLHLYPSLGRVAVAPAAGQGEAPLSSGRFGGNLAMANLETGDRITLPVFRSLGLLYFGDGRAAPWRGPLGSGLLTSVSTTLLVTLQKGAAPRWPRVEAPAGVSVVTVGASAVEAARAAAEDLASWLETERRLSKDAARALVSEGASFDSCPSAGGGGVVGLGRLPRALVPSPPPKGTRLGDLSWKEAEGVLSAERVVVLPLGAGSKEHGLHLLLGNDEVLANYLAGRVLADRPIALLPTLTYGFYPAFLEYPGSTSVSAATQKDVVVEICRSIARYGPRRFYVLNTGVSTARPLKETQTLLAREGIALAYSDLSKVGKAAEEGVREETYGTHADEVETSMLLYIDPRAVRMDRAVADGAKERPGPLTRDPNRSDGHFSPSGVFGDPTLATRAKGRILVEGMVADILAEIDHLAAETPPLGTPLSPLE